MGVMAASHCPSCSSATLWMTLKKLWNVLVLVMFVALFNDVHKPANTQLMMCFRYIICSSVFGRSNSLFKSSIILARSGLLIAKVLFVVAIKGLQSCPLWQQLYKLQWYLNWGYNIICTCDSSRVTAWTLQD